MLRGAVPVGRDANWPVGVADGQLDDAARGVPCCAFLFLPLDKAYPRRPAATAELAARSAAPVLVSGKTRTTTVGFSAAGSQTPSAVDGRRSRVAPKSAA